MAGSKARGPLREWGDSPSWGGSGAPVDRSSARPDFLDRGGFDPETTALAGVRLPWNQPGKPFFADAGELLDELLGQLRQLTESVDLEKLIQRLLGPQCFVLGVVYGVGENFVVSILDLMGMFKTLLLAELYDSTRRNPGWTVWQPGGIARYLTAQMLNEYFGEELHQAAEERDALWAEIKRVFENPGDFFGGMRDQYVKKFNRLLALSADPSPESQFQAGRVFGDLLMDVLVVIGAGAAVAKVASKVPRLLKLAGKLKGKVALRSAVGAGEAEVAASRSGPPPKKVARPSPAREPKPAAAETPIVPKLPGPMAEKVLYGTKNAKGKLIGAHSPEVLNRPDFKVKIEKVNPDGTMEAVLQKQWPDGTWSPPKRSTLAPKTWSDTKIVEVTEKIASGNPVGTPRVPGGDSLHASTLDGVPWVVIKDKMGAVTASYPSATLPTGFGL